jgi:hypothetical protein
LFPGDSRFNECQAVPLVDAKYPIHPAQIEYDRAWNFRSGASLHVGSLGADGDDRISCLIGQLYDLLDLIGVTRTYQVVGRKVLAGTFEADDGAAEIWFFTTFPAPTMLAIRSGILLMILSLLKTAFTAD